jgi:hypothetical protein
MNLIRQSRFLEMFSASFIALNAFTIPQVSSLNLFSWS